MYVIKDTALGPYLKKCSGFIEWTDDINKARTFVRKSDASCCISYNDIKYCKIVEVEIEEK